jgi:hypothetical protein
VTWIISTPQFFSIVTCLLKSVQTSTSIFVETKSFPATWKIGYLLSLTMSGSFTNVDKLKRPLGKVMLQSGAEPINKQVPHSQGHELKLLAGLQFSHVVSQPRVALLSRDDEVFA